MWHFKTTLRDLKKKKKRKVENCCSEPRHIPAGWVLSSVESPCRWWARFQSQTQQGRELSRPPVRAQSQICSLPPQRQDTDLAVDGGRIPAQTSLALPDPPQQPVGWEEGEGNVVKEEKIAYFQRRVVRKAPCVRVCKCKASKRQEHNAGRKEAG